MGPNRSTVGLSRSIGGAKQVKGCGQASQGVELIGGGQAVQGVGSMVGAKHVKGCGQASQGVGLSR